MSKIPGLAPLSEYGKSKYKRILLYGAPGSGKTLFALRSQYMKAAVLDIDNGLETVFNFRGTDALLPAKKENIFVEDGVVYNNNGKLETLSTWLSFLSKIKANSDKLDLMVVDSMSEFVNRSVESSKESRSLARKQDWGVAYDNCSRFMRIASNIPIHQIYIAHETEVKTTLASGEQVFKEYAPKIPGQSNDLMQELTSETWRMTVANDGQGRPMFGIQCQKSGTVHAKTRSNLELFEPADIDIIFGKLLSETTG